MSLPRHDKRLVTAFLRELAAEVYTMAPDGDPVTRAEALATALWDRALGFEEPDPDDPARRIRHQPASWAIQMVYERLEGKVAQADEVSTAATTADRVSDLARNNLNALAVSVTDPAPKVPPIRKKTPPTDG